MGKKERNKKLKSTASSSNASFRQRSKSRGNDDVYKNPDKKDDYGFLDSQKCQQTKGEEHCYTGKRRDANSRHRRLEVAKQYGCISTQPRSQRSLPHKQGSGQAYHNTQCQAEPKTLEFYPQVAERQSRSTSRPSRASRPARQDSNARPDRSRSKSRDIVALYTSQALPRSRSSTPAGSLRSYLYTPTPTVNERPTVRSRSCTPARSLSNYQHTPLSSTSSYNYSASGSATPVLVHTVPSRRSRSVVPSARDRSSIVAASSTATTPRRARSETRYGGDLISLASNISTQSRALSNSEIASQNLELWMNTTSKSQRASSATRKKERKNSSFVTLLEMDPQKNEAIEKLLNNSSSVKPANVRMMMIAGHEPSDNWESKDEVAVKSGTIITGLYKQNEWLSVRLENGFSGYVPYAYTKAIKVTPLESSTKKSEKKPHPPSTSRSTNQNSIPGASILKNSKATSAPSHRQYSKNGLTQPKPSTSATYRDSLSSSNSVFLEELLCARPAAVPRQTYQQNNFADCMVVDNEPKFDGMLHDDMRAYCSDSGISEPNSNHGSDELDRYVSLVNTHHQPQQPIYAAHALTSSTDRSGHYLNIDQYRSSSETTNHHAGRNYAESRNIGHSSNISFLPLGPLGERLQSTSNTPQLWGREVSDNEVPIYSNISQEMNSRAQPSSQYIPNELKPEIPKDYNGPRVRVIYDYTGENEDDVHVRAGEVVTLLNGEDIEWIWVMRRDGCEGFMPLEYVLPIDVCRPKPKLPNTGRHLIIAL